jgi:DNA primase
VDAIEEVKNRLNIEDVIGEYVQLKRAGRNWRGLSPFSNEKTPSFMVSPEKQIWHDFSSGKGGNVFSFIMETEGLDFKEALELLARKAGVDLSQYRDGSSTSRSKDKERLYELLELATKFYQVQFSHNRTALSYVLQTRNFSKQTALQWRFGYAPASGTSLTNFLQKRGFTVAEIKQAGLCVTRYHGNGDMFIKRLMIPLSDAQGRVIGFTARLLDDDTDAPKYINTPQTLLYDKSRNIFGFHFAKDAIRKNHYAVLVEGNLDVIASHQAGVAQVVATAGTALTPQHLKILSRFTTDIRLCFDADSAGIKATERAIPIASRANVSLCIINLPSGKDPDELIQDNPKQWIKALEQPKYAIDWLIEHYQSKLDLNSALGKRQFSDIILKVVGGLSDLVEQEHYIEKIAQMIHVSRAALLSKLHPESSPRLKSRHSRKSEVISKDVEESIKIQDHLLSLILLQPKLRDFMLYLQPTMMLNASAKELLTFLQSNPEFAGDPSVAPQLHQITDYVKILMLQYEALYQDIDLLELRYEAARLQARLIEHYVKTQKNILITKLEAADDSQTQTLLRQAKKLDELLNKARET